MNGGEITLHVSREHVTLAIAVAGLALGILNTWRSIARDRPRVRVRVMGWLNSYGESGFCLEVSNVGCVPVSVAQVGILLSRPRGHMFLFAPHGIGADSFPRALAAGESVTVYAPPGTDDDPALAFASRAFAKTATGLLFRSPRRDVRRHLAQRRPA